MTMSREDVLEIFNEKNTKILIEALNKLQQNAHCKRGEAKDGISTSDSNHVVGGNTVLRGGHGFGVGKMTAKDKKVRGNLQKWAGRMQSLIQRKLPTDLIRAVSMAAQAGCWPTIGKCKFFAALAANIDCAAPSHVDVDFFSLFFN